MPTLHLPLAMNPQCGLPTFEWTKKLREMSLTLDYNETSKEV